MIPPSSVCPIVCRQIDFSFSITRTLNFLVSFVHVYALSFRARHAMDAISAIPRKKNIRPKSFFQNCAVARESFFPSLARNTTSGLQQPARKAHAYSINRNIAREQSYKAEISTPPPNPARCSIGFRYRVVILRYVNADV